MKKNHKNIKTIKEKNHKVRKKRWIKGESDKNIKKGAEEKKKSTRRKKQRRRQ